MFMKKKELLECPLTVLV